MMTSALRFAIVVSLLSLVLCACGGEEDCAENEVEVTYIGTANDRTECKPAPAICGGVGDCADQDCLGAMYDLCEAPAFGVGCSDTFLPPIISCNE